MGIKQLSANWSALEDRIDFSFNTEEGELYRFWFTRSIAKAVLSQSQLVVQAELSTQHNARASQLIQEFQKEGLKKQIAFTDAFEGGNHTPLGSEGILVSNVTMALEGDAVAIALTLVSNQIVRFRLNTAQLQAWSLLIERLAGQAQWAIADPETISLDADAPSQLMAAPNLH